MPVLQGERAMLADLLFALDAVQFGEFRLKVHEKHPEAPLSPIYLNLRTPDHPSHPGPLTPEALALIGRLMAVTFDESREGWTEAYFTGIPEAGEPFADAFEPALALRGLRMKRLKLRKENLPDGRRRITTTTDVIVREGDAPPSVLVLDDVISHALSKLEATQALTDMGMRVRFVLVLVDREQGGQHELATAGYRLLSVFKLSELLDHYVEHGFITAEQAAKVRDYLASN